MSNRTRAILGLVVLGVAAFLFFATTQHGTGVVDSKWPETTSSCDKNGQNCSTETTYYIQLQGGGIYALQWKKIDFDKVTAGATVEFTAHGLDVRPFGLRLMVPSITTLKVVAR